MQTPPLDLTAFLANARLFLLVCIVLYVYFAFLLMVIAAKTSTPNAWLAWIPIGNLYLMCRIARRTPALTVAMLVPFINIIVAMVLWWDIARARGKPGWIGLLIVVPGINLLMPLYLAFGGSTPIAMPPLKIGTSAAAGMPLAQSAPSVPSAVSSSQFCTTCGSRLEPGDRFCTDCGATVLTEPPAESAAALPPPPTPTRDIQPAPRRSAASVLAAVGAAAVAIAAGGGYYWSSARKAVRVAERPVAPQAAPTPTTAPTARGAASPSVPGLAPTANRSSEGLPATERNRSSGAVAPTVAPAAPPISKRPAPASAASTSPPASPPVTSPLVTPGGNGPPSTPVASPTAAASRSSREAAPSSGPAAETTPLNSSPPASVPSPNPTNNTAAPSPSPSATASPTTPPASTPEATTSVYRGPTSGIIRWSGAVDRDGLITIQGSSATTGSLVGGLPGVPIQIQLLSKDIAVAEAPAPSNGWSRLVLRSRTRQTVIQVQWQVLR